MTGTSEVRIWPAVINLLVDVLVLWFPSIPWPIKVAVSIVLALITYATINPRFRVDIPAVYYLLIVLVSMGVSVVEFYVALRIGEQWYRFWRDPGLFEVAQFGVVYAVGIGLPLAYLSLFTQSKEQTNDGTPIPISMAYVGCTVQLGAIGLMIVLGLVFVFIPFRIESALIGRAFVGILGPAFALFYSLWEYLNQVARDMNATGSAGPVLPNLILVAAWLLVPITALVTILQNAQFPLIARFVVSFQRRRQLPQET